MLELRNKGMNKGITLKFEIFIVFYNKSNSDHGSICDLLLMNRRSPLTK